MSVTSRLSRISLLVALAISVSSCGRPLAKVSDCEVAVHAFRILAIDTHRDVRWSLDTPTAFPRFVTPEKFVHDRSPSLSMPLPETFQAVPGLGLVRPQASTIRALTRGAPENVDSCPAVRQTALALHALPSSPDDDSAPAADGLYKVKRVTMSKPAVSADGSEALVYVTSSSGPLAASGQLFLLRRDAHGDWSVAGVATLWIA